ncbi:MAG: acyl-CoA thioesterase [Alphaproteobacteria bacterium]|nr:acyl-CoA thioesterase [Alphaproteobacteria bacterium]
MSPNVEGKGATNFETAFNVEIFPKPEDFDELGHVNNAVYLRWAQEIAVRHWTTAAPPALQARRLFVVLRHEVDYRDPVLPGDPVIGRTWLGPANGPRFERTVDIRKPGARRAAAFVKSVWCMLDIETRRPLRVGKDVLDAFGVSGE